MMRINWAKWGLLVAGSTLAGGGLGACISELLLQTFILTAVN